MTDIVLSPMNTNTTKDENSSFESPECRHINSVLEDIPVGKFHYMLLVICGLSFMADAMEVSLLSFMATCVGNQWDLTDNEVALITSMVFAGVLLGSLFWGPIADIFGRRRAFLWSAAIIIVAGFISACVQDYTSLVLFRALVGFGVGGITVPFDLLAEFLPNSHRGSFLMYIEYFWTIGSLFVAGAAWATLSSEGWRVLTFITAAPVTIGLLFSIVYLPESPRWLLVQGRVAEAEQVIQDVAVVNCYPLRPFRLQALTKDDMVEVSVLEFLAPEHLKLSIPLWTVWLAFGFTYYGVILYVARIFEHSSDDDDDNSGPVCDFDYHEIFISAVAEVIGVTTAVCIIDRWGRVSTQAALYAGAAVSVFLMGMGLPSAALTAVSVMGRCTAMGAASATWVATPEMYNTHMRATGHSIANSVSHLGGFLVPFLIDSSKVSVGDVGIVLGVVNLIAVVATLFLPETNNIELDENHHDRESIASNSFNSEAKQLVSSGGQMNSSSAEINFENTA